ncbi:tripartite motif-containing protein 6-like [Grus americana]|uniref:tripartite motif-containing protein 6-like n=1 Tax=Grus americana TaxID=9117 RepID=UPI002407E65E|nr:tripartite motif-containing protein 6-like [Grus americana]
MASAGVAHERQAAGRRRAMTFPCEGEEAAASCPQSEREAPCCYHFLFLFPPVPSLQPSALYCTSGAMADLGAVATFEEDLTCPICLSIYSNPVSLSCGHSFCKKCIQEAQSHQHGPQSLFSCPLCCAQAGPAMELQPNIQLRSIVQKFLDAPTHEEEKNSEVQREEKGESSAQQDEVILCDFCLQEPQPALKTCLSCEASLCQAHLSKHSTNNSLKDHVLMEPCNALGLAERRCSQHGKLLECYCKTDSVCICMLCCVTSTHKNHKIIALEEAHRQAQSVFPETLKTMKRHEAALNQSIASLLKQEEEVKTKESWQRNQLESLFKDMHQQLDNKKGEILEVLSRNEEQQLSQIQTQIQKLRKGKDAASREVQELEALRDQKDLLLFTKAFSAIRTRKHKAVPNKAVVKLSKPTSISMDELTTEITQMLFQQFLSDMQSSFKTPPVHEHLTSSMYQGGGSAYRSNTVIASSLVSFSFGIPYPYSPIPHAQSDQSFSEGCHFWEVDTSNASRWKLGITQPNIECYLQLSNCYLSVFLGQAMISEKNLPAALKVVRVELDCGRNTLSFYNVSVKDGDPAESLELLQRVNIPSKYPARAIFGVSDGSLNLL